LALDHYGFVAASDLWWQSSGPEYELDDLPPGQYYVFFLSEGWGYDAETGTVINEFYNNVTQWPQATKVTVTEGGTATGVNFDLQSNSGYVAVTIRDGAGQPLANTAADFELFPYLPTEDNELLDQGRTLRFGLQTDGSGQATIGPIPLGTFYMNCRVENYAMVYYPNTGDPMAAQSLTLSTVNQTISGIQFDMPPGGNISGVVTLDDGTPGMFVQIEAYPVGADDYIATTFSMFDGAYELNGIPPGQYLIRAFPGFILPDYAAEYWDDKPSAETADPVQVEPGQTTSGIDFVLSPGGSINGTIASDISDAFTDAFFIVWAYPPDDSLRSVAYTFTSGLGEYTLGGLREGDYKVALQGIPFPVLPLYYDNALSFEDASVVSVPASGTADGIDFFLPSRGRISGRVTLVGGAPATTEEVEFVIAYPEELLTQGDLGLWFLFPSMVNDDGTYTIAGLPTGGYRVWVSAYPAGYDEIGYCSEYHGGAFNFDAATVVQVTDGQTTTGIDVQLDREAIVQGFVSLPGGSPAGDRDTEVVLIAYDAQLGYPVGIGVSDEAPVYTDDNNTFCAGYRIRRLPARAVKVAAVPYGAPAAVGYYGGGHTFDQGGSVTLTAGQVFASDVNITLEPGNATISGMVTRQDDGSPLNWVVVASYDLTGHLSGFAASGVNPATDDPWQNGRYEIRSLFNGSTHYVRTWSLFSWLYYGMLNPDSGIAITDEWYEELDTFDLPLELGYLMPFGYYYFFGFMPYVDPPFDATQVPAPSSNINFTLGFQGQGSDTHPGLPGDLTLESLSPNPANGRIALTLSVGSSQPVRAELVDLAGRRLGVLNLGTLRPGIHHVSIDVGAFGAPAAGAYLVRIQGVDATRAQRVVLLP
ncbi:MAG: carboxypeptidase-like regulatory domain-containing protein, partial [Candidatus Eisenbacteria bacterium]|nr:carboxypeptidase-like regulatory domain-containing protein [Candidatus Eisenbacteria bacterium]